jgi:hypothetical protein
MSALPLKADIRRAPRAQTPTRRGYPFEWLENPAVVTRTLPVGRFADRSVLDNRSFLNPGI